MTYLIFSDSESTNANTTSQSVTDTVRLYLQEIGRIPLLTQEQEIFLAQQVQQMMKILAAQKKLSVKLNRTPTMPELANQVHLGEQEILQQLNQGKKAKEKMIVANLRLVVSIAKQYQRRNLDFLDLIQEGTLGLERGVEKFDPNRGYRFSTYVYWWIRQGITRGIAQQGRAIRLPIHIHEKLNKIKRTQRELSQKFGRIPTIKEIADALDLNAFQVREYLLLARQPISLDMKVGTEQDTVLQDLIEDGKSSNLGNSNDAELLKQDMQILLSKLSRQQQKVLNLKFGLVDGHELSLEQISQNMGISRERVRQIKNQALSLLQRQLIES